MKITTKALVFTALLAALVCVVSPFSLPIGVVPLSLCSFAVYIAAGLISFKHGTVAVLVYVVLGAFGVPVFSGFSGGFSHIAGPTGGYIVGYIACAFVSAIIIDKLEKYIWAFPVAYIAGTVVLYFIGTVWYMAQSGVSLGAALLACVVPFLIGDAIKIVVATAICFKLRALIKKQFLLKPKTENREDVNNENKQNVNSQDNSQDSQSKH